MAEAWGAATWADESLARAETAEDGAGGAWLFSAVEHPKSAAMAMLAMVMLAMVMLARAA